MRVLIVEDEENISQYLAKSLKAEGYEVDATADGAEALDLIIERPYDLITLDIILPGLNGYEVCEQARAAGIETPIRMLTAKDGEYDEADAFEMGADDFLRKPFSLVVLLARVKALLRRGPSTHADVLEAAGLVLDPRSHKLTCDGEPIELTVREFDLLSYLMRNKGTAVSKADLLDYVWGTDRQGDDNIVEVYMRYIRRKIDKPDQPSRIDTVRGVGYRIG